MKHLDLDQQAVEIGIDRGTLLSLYYVFIKQTEKDLVSLKELIEKKDKSSLRDLAHHIKGACLNLEINSMAESSRIIIEECIGGENWSLIKEKVSMLEQQFHELKLLIAMEDRSVR